MYELLFIYARLKFLLAKNVFITTSKYWNRSVDAYFIYFSMVHRNVLQYDGRKSFQSRHHQKKSWLERDLYFDMRYSNPYQILYHSPSSIYSTRSHLNIKLELWWNFKLKYLTSKSDNYRNESDRYYNLVPNR